tara:strand:- start:197 stop:367 length:171 start_codon:yes stop_codon:yes gene_type:complete
MSCYYKYDDVNDGNKKMIVSRNRPTDFGGSISDQVEKEMENDDLPPPPPLPPPPNL